MRANKEPYSAEYHFSERTAGKIKKYLDETPNVQRRYEDEKVTLYVVKDGLGGRILFLEDFHRVMLSSVDLDTFAEIGKIITGGKK